MKDFGTRIKKEIIRMELVNIYYINVEHDAKITESPKETIDKNHFIADYKYIMAKETFYYKAFSLN